MAITGTTASSGKGYTPELSPAAQASLEKGRQERAAKAAQGTAAKETAATTATQSTTATSGAAAPQSSSTVAATQKTSSTTVSISNEARAKLEAEKSGGTAQGSSGSSALTYSATPTKFRTATPAQGGAQTNEASASGGKPQSIKFGSVDEAIAYGTRKANEQAAAKTGKPSAEMKNDAAAPTKETSTNGSKPQSVKFGSVDEAIAYGTRKANEQAAAKSKALQA